MRKNAKNIRQTANRGEGNQEWFVHSSREQVLATQGISSVGWVVPGEGYLFVRSSQDWPLLYATVSGAGEVLIDEEWCRCEVGAAYITPAGQIAGYRKIPGVAWQAVWVVATDAGLLGKELSRLVPANPTPLLHAVQGLYEEDMGRPERVVVEHYVGLIVAHTRRIARGNARASRVLQSVWERVLSDLPHGWTRAELAELACVSESTLRRLCDAELRRSPLEQVTFLRMRHATSLLMTTDLSVGEIAGQVGYSNPLAFSTAFKRVMGVPPTQIRHRR